MVSVAYLVLLAAASDALFLFGPNAGVLKTGDSVLAYVTDDGPVEVRWHRGNSVVARAKCSNQVLAMDTPLRIVRIGADRILTFWTGWATGYARQFILLQDKPPRMTIVGSFENGTVADLASKGITWEYRRHESIQVSRETGKSVWVGRKHLWNPKTKRFAEIATKRVPKLPAESKRRFDR